MKHNRAISVAVFVLFVAVMPLLAHHSIQAEFDSEKTFTMTGTLKKVDWINPHSVTWIAVMDEETGKVVDGGCQGNPPNTYHRAGLKKADWKIGEVVSLTCSAAKDGSKNWGFIKMIKYHSDGHVIVIRLGGV